MANMGLASILEKMIGKDENDRYMATLDLLNELNKEEFEVDGDLEIRLSNIIPQQLDDAVGDISELALKCLAPLVKKVSLARLIEMTEKLCDKLLNGNKQNRDVAGIALKTILSEATDQEDVDIVLCILTPKLFKGTVESGMTTEIKCECLDLLCYVLHKYGSLVADINEMLLAALLSQLNSNQASVGKRVVSCIALLASSLSDDLLAKTIVRVVRLLKPKPTKLEITRRYIQIIVSLSLAAGYRFGPYLGDTVPLLMGYCMSTAETDEELLWV